MPAMDGFSVLPDSLLVHILSYLPIKEAVQAQLISKRWKNMCAYLPVLDFDFADFWSEDIFSHGEYSTYVSEDSECHENFVRAIDAVLTSLLIQQIDRFRLVWKYQVKYYHEHPVRRLILHILQLSPHVLSIYVQPSDVKIYVPDTVFTCSSLKEIKLQVDSRWPVVLEPASVNLPSLRRLNLGYYTIKDDFMNKLLLGCPNLEELELYTCRLKLSQISSDSLKYLVIDGCCNSTDILVSIPSLQYLKVTVLSCQTAEIVFDSMFSLLKACVCFLTADELFDKSFYDSEAKMLNGLSGVANLDILLDGSEAEGMLRHALTNCPDFKNLKAVHVESFDGCLVDCMDIIERLIQNSSTFEDLTFYCCKDGSDETELLNELSEIVPANCRLVGCNQGRIYNSLDKLKKQVIQYMIRLEKMDMEITAEELNEEEDELIEVAAEEDVEEEEEEEEEEDDFGGEALLEEEEDGLEEEEEEEDEDEDVE